MSKKISTFVKKAKEAGFIQPVNRLYISKQELLHDQRSKGHPLAESKLIYYQKMGLLSAPLAGPKLEGTGKTAYFPKEQTLTRLDDIRRLKKENSLEEIRLFFILQEAIEAFSQHHSPASFLFGGQKSAKEVENLLKSCSRYSRLRELFLDLSRTFDRFALRLSMEREREDLSSAHQDIFQTLDTLKDRLENPFQKTLSQFTDVGGEDSALSEAIYKLVIRFTTAALNETALKIVQSLTREGKGP